MSELIDRQALLDECLNHYEVGNIEQNCTMDWICKTVRNFPAASPWHRVEDELPEPTTARKWYLVALESGTVMTNAFEKDRGDWWALASPVKYWMPLPEPPKEDA